MTAPLQATNTDNAWKATSGLYRVEIDSSPGRDSDPNAAPAPGGWVELKGLSKFAPKFEQSKEDDSTLASGAWKSEFPVGQGFDIDVEGFTLGEDSGGVLTIDPGLNVLLQASETYGNDGIVHVRWWRTDSLPEARAAYVTAGISRSGEKPPALDKYSGTLSGRGAPVSIQKPTGSITKTLTIGSGVTEYTVTVDGQTTATISTMTSAALRTALEALSNVGAGNVAVTGSSGGPHTIVFSVAVTTVTATGTGGSVTVS